LKLYWKQELKPDGMFLEYLMRDGKLRERSNQTFVFPSMVAGTKENKKVKDEKS